MFDGVIGAAMGGLVSSAVSGLSLSVGLKLLVNATSSIVNEVVAYTTKEKDFNMKNVVESAVIIAVDTTVNTTLNNKVDTLDLGNNAFKNTNENTIVTTNQVESGIGYYFYLGINFVGNLFSEVFSLPQYPNKSIYPHDYVGPGGRLYG